MEITTALIKELRESTGAGMMDCKKALTECNGDIQKAIEHLRQKGLASAGKKAGRAVKEGIIDSYVHLGGRIGVLIEVNCETDFVARTDEFKTLVHDLAMQVAAARPAYVCREDIPSEVLEKEKAFQEKRALEEGKPARVVEKIVEGRLEKFFEETCLLDQRFIKDDEKTVNDLIKEKIATIGENIKVARFVRFELGEQERA